MQEDVNWVAEFIKLDKLEEVSMQIEFSFKEFFLIPQLPAIPEPAAVGYRDDKATKPILQVGNKWKSSGGDGDNRYH